MGVVHIWPSSLLFLFLFSIFYSSVAVDFLSPNQSIADGETLISGKGSFELGFFSPGSSKKRYLGIWYKNIPAKTVIWVANREKPLSGHNGALQMHAGGGLVLTDGTAGIIWSSGRSGARNPVAQLLDSGNLIVRDGNQRRYKRIAWQSFDFPTDTWLPGMRFSSKMELGLTSWKNAEDPALGRYHTHMDAQGLPEIVLWEQSIQMYRTGPWNGLEFSGIPETRSYNMFSYSVVATDDEAYYEHNLTNTTIITRLVLDQSGMLQRFIWVDRIQSWNVYWSAPKDQCDVYGSCGPFGVCNSNEAPVCKCMEGFKPKSPENWNLRDRSGGCVRQRSLNCREGDVFVKVGGVKLPDTANSTVNRSMSMEECGVMCLRKCDCIAYASANVSEGGIGCVTWFSELMDLRQFSAGGQDLYVKLAASEFGVVGKIQSTDLRDKKWMVIIITVTASLILMLLASVFCFLLRKKLKQRVNIEYGENLSLLKLDAYIKDSNIPINGCKVEESGKKCIELLFFNFTIIEAATNNFSAVNKLGEGGFGPVYKGKLPNGHEVAVKRLCKESGQGCEEFKNEVMLIARLQHMSLVRLLGCCIHGEEKMLVYEYMPNKSLDSILFDPTKSALLDWKKRMRILEGIAQGLLYLHKYSRLKIIHRDLKASNILLDADMNPKISDFGMARIFGGDQNQAKTKRIVGTYGYMPPEYALLGLFSEKTDVFSFGVLLLEVVSGTKSTNFQRVGNVWTLLGYAWELWECGRALELVDPTVDDSCPQDELLRCIHVGLLCVQECAVDRPTMSTVVSSLRANTSTLPSPKQPAFSTTKNQDDSNQHSHRRGTCSPNEVTYSLVSPR